MIRSVHIKSTLLDPVAQDDHDGLNFASVRIDIFDPGVLSPALRFATTPAHRYHFIFGPVDSGVCKEVLMDRSTTRFFSHESCS